VNCLSLFFLSLFLLLLHCIVLCHCLTCLSAAIVTNKDLHIKTNKMPLWDDYDSPDVAKIKSSENGNAI